PALNLQTIYTPNMLRYANSFRGSPEDWYTIDVSNVSNVLKLETSTPSDGANEFVNTLNPHIELYNPSNALVASGAPLADGRNESILYQPLTTGSYRVRVTGEANTVGEYFLGRSGGPSVPISNRSATS